MSRALRAALGDRQMHLEPERAGVLHRPHRQLPCDSEAPRPIGRTVLALAAQSRCRRAAPPTAATQR
ncbi:hypothetical protein, partial [Xanthomonas translucens]|uniref:hypothetical protein n=1 Tax=Xanthomonas campestris pv. translucens TaxID=343 RepID=UPI0019D3AB01